MRSVVRGLMVLVATVLVTLAGPVAAQADPACASATVTGTLTGDHQVGPHCVPTPFPVLCAHPGIGFRPHAEVSASVCVPN